MRHYLYFLLAGIVIFATYSFVPATSGIDKPVGNAETFGLLDSEPFGLLDSGTLGLPSPAVSIIPAPVSLKLLPGNFLLDEKCAFVFDKKEAEANSLIPVFVNAIGDITNIDIPVNPEERAAKSIYIKIKKNKVIGNEGYTLDIASKYIILTANTRTGLFYGLQSLLQVIGQSQQGNGFALPNMKVEDYPRFGWRGMHLDVSRHFFPKSFIKEYIDLMARYKMNVFHWHLCDDQGWRLEIKRYPKLTSAGAWRADRPGKSWMERAAPSPDEPATYGGFYTQEEVREVVAYAREKGITVLPEIEMPGHSSAVLAAYPEYSCHGTPVLVQTGGNYSYAPTFCAGKDSTFLFIQNILEEVIQLFPSEFIHVGGDEVDKSFWQDCPKCQQRKVLEGLKDEDELQSYFIRRMEKFLLSKGRRLIGWDEILEGGLAPEAAVMSWRGVAGGIAAAKQRHYVVMSPGTHCYFDHYQGDPETEPLAIGGYTTLKKVYSYEPVPAELTPDEAKYIMGAQANLWTEWIETGTHAEYMVLPRMLALSEVVWSPAAIRNWQDFRSRLKQHYRWFDQQGLNYSKGTFRVEIKPVADTVLHTLSALLESEAEDVTIHYTLDGTDPNGRSPVYESPVAIDRSLTIKAVAIQEDVPLRKPNARRFEIHKASGKQVSYEMSNNSNYPADGQNTLTDGIRGTKEIGKSWHGFLGNDLVATIDLGDIMSVDSIVLSCLQRYESWIFLPDYVTFSVSVDGISFSDIDKVDNKTAPEERGYIFQNFSVRNTAGVCRYIRVRAKNIGTCPPGHPGEGKGAWIFVDEVIVK